MAPFRPSFRSSLELLRARWLLLASLGSAAVGAFLKLTSELDEGELQGFDKAALEAVIAMRTPALNGIAVDVTALGSMTVLTLIVTVAACCFALYAHWGSAAQLVIAAVGGGTISELLKMVLERERPDVVGRLVHVASHSYPSGHSMASASAYLTLAIVVARWLPQPHARKIVVVFALVLAATIGLSRAYLGVHYPSDIAAGLLLGAGWSLLISAAFSYGRGKGHISNEDAPAT